MKTGYFTDKDGDVLPIWTGNASPGINPPNGLGDCGICGNQIHIGDTVTSRNGSNFAHILCLDEYDKAIRDAFRQRRVAEIVDALLLDAAEDGPA